MSSYVHPMLPVTTPSLIHINNLTKHFVATKGILRRKTGTIKAVDGISLTIQQGETLGLVGESGCGKTTVGRTILQLYRPTSGSIQLQGQELTTMRGKKLRSIRRAMQMIFQDPYTSFNPRKTIGSTLAEPIQVHQLRTSKRAIAHRVHELLELVGLNPSYANRYPHEFSGGQRQRIGIARALAVEPTFIVCDEPVSALDVSIQAQIVNLLEALQAQLNLTYLFIAHDLSVVRHMSNRIAIMYLGKIVELASAESLIQNPLHPYTAALLSAVPIPDPKIERQRQRIILHGEVPSPLHPPSGCAFHPRCPLATAQCREETPLLQEYEDGHVAACFHC